MKAMVLAAGLGTRLRPLTNDRPKALVEVGGRPLITYPLALLRRYGITEVVVNLHWHAEALRNALGDGSRLGLSIVYSEEDPLLDTGGGIKRAAPLLGAGDFVVMNSDTILDLPLDRVIARHRARAADATLVLRHDPEQARYGEIEIDALGRVRRWLGLPARAPLPLTPYMFAGVHVLSRRVFDFMPADDIFSITRQTYPAMLAADAALQGFPFDGFWRVIDTPADRERAARDLAGARLAHLGGTGVG
ncbi:MAG: NDP-sugar synthase [Deltaproteobacteria bacterium]|nr:NDP-sugar synthase [Deltaproteobacteria bacterium]